MAQVGSQLSGAQEQACAQVPQHMPEPLLARHPVWDRTLEKPTYAVPVCSSAELLLHFHMFLTSVIKRSRIWSMFTSYVGPCGFGLSWAAHKGHVGVEAASGAVWWRRDVSGWTPWLSGKENYC